MDNKLYDNIGSMVKKNAKSRDMYKILFTTEDGKDIEYEIILTFKSKENKKIYYIMTDNTRSTKNELNITSFYINYNENSEVFYPVVDDEELKMVFEVFDKVQSNL